MTAELWSIHQQTGLAMSPDAFASIVRGQRERFLKTFEAFDAERWLQASRCGEWNAHTVLRHLTDGTELQAGGMTGIQPSFAKPMSEFNPQTTPDEWLSASVNETPAETLSRYAEASQVSLEAVDAAFRAGDDRTTFGPYGQAHWSVVAVHVLWDSWIHERDILMVDGANPDGISGDAAEQRLCTMYGALMTTVPAVRFGLPMAATMTLQDGDTSFHLELQAEPEAITAIEHNELESPDLRGELLPVADSLAGRGAPLADVLAGPSELVGGMAILGQAI